MMDKKTTTRMLTDLIQEIEIGTITGKQAALIESFNRQFHSSKYLSTRQTEILTDIYNNFMGI